MQAPVARRAGGKETGRRTMLMELSRRLIRALLRPVVTGDAAALRPQAPVLAVANHLSAVDALVLACALPVDAVFVVSRDATASRTVRWCMRLFETLQVDLSEALTLRRLARLVASGRTIVLFPEGRVGRTGSLMKLYDAPAIVAARSGIAVVPIHVCGTGQTHRRGSVTRLRDLLGLSVRIHVGRPAVIALAPGLAARERRRQAGARLRALLQEAMVEARPARNVFESLLDAAEAHGRATLVMEDVNQVEMSYGTLLKAALALGRLVERISIEREVVGVLMPNVFATVGLFFGMNAMARVPAMLNYSAGPDALRHAIEVAGIRTVITSRKFVENARLERLIRACGEVRVVYLEDLRAGLTLGDKLWLVAWALRRPRSVARPVRPQDTAVVLFTSGSEGRSKGVALSHDGLLANMAQMHAVIDFGVRDKFLNALPMYHTYGLVACTLMPLLYGARLFLYTNPLHYRIVPEIAYSRDCTYLFGTSTFLGHYARNAKPYDFRSVRYVISGGEKLNPDVQRLYAEKFGLRVLEGYGATECGPALALNAPQQYREASVGRLLPGVEARVLPVAGIERGGELHVRSPNLMLGYYLADRPGVVRPPSSQVGAGWYCTGDIVEIDAEGFVAVVGRLKRFAKVAGEMVPLELVERLARASSPGFEHAASVASLPDRGESTLLFTTDPALDRARLHQTARALGLQELAVARSIVHVRSLPVLGSGKTDYVRLGELACEMGERTGTVSGGAALRA